MKIQEQAVLATLVIVAIFCNLAFNIENNDSRLVYVPKSEFVRVLSEIVSGPGTSSNQREVVEGDEDSTEDDGGQRMQDTSRDEAPRSRASKQTQIESKLRRFNQQAAQSLHGKKGYVKSDSLYFLQKSMELRESALHERSRSGDNQLNSDHVL